MTSTFEIAPVQHGEYREIDDDPVFRQLVTLNTSLNAARESMQPYFDNYKQLFKSVTSNLSPMKFLPTQIGQRFQCQNPNNVWIKIYEVVAANGLIPTGDAHCQRWRYYDFNCLPGNNLLAVVHYVYTKAADDVKENFEWIGNIQDDDDIKERDYFDLHHNYTGKGNFRIIDFSRDDEDDPAYLSSVDLFISTSENRISHDYRNQEANDCSYLVQGVAAALRYLKQGGHAVFRLTSFFNKATISTIAALRKTFREVSIFRPMSAKMDSMETYLICKSHYITEETNGLADHIFDYIGENKDYFNTPIIPIGDIIGDFWNSLLAAARAITRGVIADIEHNIEVFDEALNACGDQDGSALSEFTRKRSADRIDATIAAWYERYPLIDLPKKFALNIRPEQPRDFNRGGGRGRAGHSGSYDGRGRAGHNGGRGRGGYDRGRGGHNGRGGQHSSGSREKISDTDWNIVKRK